MGTICTLPLCRSYYPYSYEWEFIQDLSKDSFMIPDINRNNTTGATSGAGTVYPSRVHELILVFSETRVA